MSPTKKTPRAEAPPAEASKAAPAAMNPEPATVAPATVPCANCGAPAIFKTTSRAANVTHYCEGCGRQVYPRDLGELERIQ